MRYRAPRRAMEQHQRLNHLGIVGLVRRQLLANPFTANVADLICWIVRESAAGEVTYKIVCHYRRWPIDPMGQRPQSPVVAESEFTVSTTVPFGLGMAKLQALPLPEAKVTGIHNIVESFGV